MTFHPSSAWLLVLLPLALLPFWAWRRRAFRLHGSRNIPWACS